MYRTLKSLARNFDFETQEDAAQYIFNSYINGNKKQARELYLGLTKNERNNAVAYVRDAGYPYETMAVIVADFYANAR